jgi:hypothetical protein
MPKHLTVTARPAGGFRRCGRRWTAEPQSVPADAFTEAEIAALKADPNLVVTEQDGPVKGSGKGKTANAPTPTGAGDGAA